MFFQIFWRTGGFLLGHVLETAFKDNIYVELKSFPNTPGKPCQRTSMNVATPGRTVDMLIPVHVFCNTIHVVQTIYQMSVLLCVWCKLKSFLMLDNSRSYIAMRWQGTFTWFLDYWWGCWMVNHSIHITLYIQSLIRMENNLIW